MIPAISPLRGLIIYNHIIYNHIIPSGFEWEILKGRHYYSKSIYMRTKTRRGEILDAYVVVMLYIDEDGFSE
jgi:hypothetical protein